MESPHSASLTPTPDCNTPIVLHGLGLRIWVPAETAEEYMRRQAAIRLATSMELERIQREGELWERRLTIGARTAAALIWFGFVALAVWLV